MDMGLAVGGNRTEGEDRPGVKLVDMRGQTDGCLMGQRCGLGCRKKRGKEDASQGRTWPTLPTSVRWIWFDFFIAQSPIWSGVVQLNSANFAVSAMKMAFRAANVVTQEWVLYRITIDQFLPLRPSRLPFSLSLSLSFHPSILRLFMRQHPHENGRKIRCFHPRAYATSLF